MTLKNVYIVATQRSPVTKAHKGAFVHLRADDLLATCISETLAKVPAIAAKDIEDVIIGCAMPEAEQGMNVARIGALLAGLPDSVCGMTINRFCSSGVQSIVLAAQRIATGGAEVMVAGGVESMSAIPMGGHHISPNPKLFSSDKKYLGIAYGMGITAENVAKKYKISRADQDAFALQSHHRACAAQKAGYFNAEILPIETILRQPQLSNGNIIKTKIMVDQDEGPRSDASLKALTGLKSAFAQDGTVTAGNSSQVSDGAGIAVLVSEGYLKKHKLTPLARIVSFATAGVPPEFMGIGPVEAIAKALKQAGLKLKDIDWIELNEAFAAQSLAVIKQAKLDPKKVNPLGSAIALGHPLGATGAIRTATLIHGLRRIQKRYGMVTMCIGTGMGVAAIFEII